MKQMLFLLFIIVLSQPSDSANILGIFDFPSYSHQLVYQKIVKDLSARGHHLTIVTVNSINQDFPNVTEILIHGSYEKHSLNFAESKENKHGMVRKFLSGIVSCLNKFIDHINHPEMNKLINNTKNQKFDLLLIEFIFYNPMIYFAEVYDCPVIGISPLETSNTVHEFFGNYVNAAVRADDNVEYESGNMTLVERFVSVAGQIGVWLFQPFFEAVCGYKMKRYFPNVNVSWSDIHKNRLEFLMQNYNPVFGATQPVTHNTIMIGNINLEPPKKLDNELESFLDGSKNGVVYVSFGTNVNTNGLNSNAMSVFINTFKNLKYDILWKVDDMSLNKSTNIHTSNWYPQSDLLAHPNIKLFITHCGLLSLEESIDREVPVIAIPFQFDQYKNAFTVRREQIGMYLEYESLTEEVLHHAIMEVTTNSKFKENIKKLKTLMHDVPMPAREKAVWWIEYALRNKGKNKLKFFGNKIPFYQKYCLDIGLFVVGFLIVSIKFVGLLMRVFGKEKVKVE